MKIAHTASLRFMNNSSFEDGYVRLKQKSQYRGAGVAELLIEKLPTVSTVETRDAMRS